MNLLFRICDESVQCNDNRNAVFLKVLNMLLKVDNTFLQCFKIWYGCLCLRNAAVVFQGTNCSNQDNSIRFQTSHTTFDIEEFLSTEISTKTGFCYNDICHLLHAHYCSHERYWQMVRRGRWPVYVPGSGSDSASTHPSGVLP